MVRSARHQANSDRTRLNVCMLNSYCLRVRGAVGALGVALKVPETVTPEEIRDLEIETDVQRLTRRMDEFDEGEEAAS